MSYHRQSKRQDLDERKSDVKAKARYGDVVAALGIDGGDDGDRCPFCHGDGLSACHHGVGAYCNICQHTADMIDLVREKLGVGFCGAIEFLENLITTKRDAHTGDLFG